VLALLGAGGMGEVYRARDTRLNRDVAIKILRAGLADHPVRRARFEREAQAIASLSHPNICAVYDVGAQDGVAYLVMEYIEGESLERCLRRGPLPPVTALRWAIQIAGALAAAHRRGIVHRDLKPANVMVAGQQVKLLDFGLAKLRDEDNAAAGTSAALEATKSLTAERAVVGTLYYMAPEQLEGREIDPRTDLFALGTVLYEMLTARKAFDGASGASVTAAILTAEPLPMSSPATGGAIATVSLDRVVRRALAKDPDERWQTARDLMNELQWVLEDGSRGTSAAAPPFGRGQRLAVVALCAVAGLVGFAAHSTLWGTKPGLAAPVHLSFFRPAGILLTNTGRPVLTISPDGTKIVFNANNQLYTRRLDAAEFIPIPGTRGTGVTTPFFSPDGRWVAFFMVGTRELKKIPVDGGAAVTISQAPAGSPVGNFGASWTGDNQVLFATREGVFQVSGNGGTPRKIVDLEPGETGHGPQMLPDGDHLLLTVTTATGADRWDKAQIIAQSLSSGARTVLIDGGADGRYLDTGHIIYAVGTTLFAVPADVRSLRILGPPVTVVRGVRRSPQPGVNTAAAFAAISTTGDLAYIPDTPDSSLNAFVDLNGRITPLPDNGLVAARVSPDGSHAVTRPADGTGLWIYPVTRRAAPRRLAAEGSNSDALWTPDGTRITFRSQRDSGAGMFWQRADGTGAAELLLAVDGRPVGWSRDGKTLFYLPLSAKEIWSWTRGEQPRSLAAIDSPYASLSPDRQWVAFHTAEHGRTIPYVQSLSNPGARFRISKDGGHAPLWSPDGRKLFYVSGDTNSLMAVGVQTTPAVVFGEAVVLVPEIEHGLALSHRNYDITPDGKQLLIMVRDRTDLRSQEVEVVLNWTAELKRLVATP
jgi:Tol biopolymer transport system component/tRNA A-37 threonylcarbamoyl transferase component Bud32